jgi:hypothetical protein
MTGIKTAVGDHIEYLVPKAGRAGCSEWAPFVSSNRRFQGDRSRRVERSILTHDGARCVAASVCVSRTP